MPDVTVIIPCYNEQDTIGLLLEAIYRQTTPRQQVEVVIADGFSTDRTRQAIGTFCEGHPDLAVRVVDNPQRKIPAALNLAIAAARGEFIIRLDAHSVPAADYIERCVEGLRLGRGQNVGGVWQIQPRRRGWLARGIAAAAAHPLGVGDALYRFTTSAGAVDTVPFGAFRRSLVGQIGGFDETLLTNEDYEFNTRIRQSGGTVWLDPEIRSVYYARPDLGALARQYYRYGYWKFQMLRRYPGTLRWRQALPPLFVLSLLGLGLFGIIWEAARWLLLGELAIYLAALLLGAALFAVHRRDGSLLAGIPPAIATMHLSWGAGFLVSMVKSLDKS